MINLIICILSLIIGLWMSIYEYKQNTNSLNIGWYVYVLRFAGWFSFGFFLAESIKYFSGVETLVF